MFLDTIFLNSLKDSEAARLVTRWGLLFGVGIFLAGLGLGAKWLSIPLLVGMMATVVILIRVELGLFAYLFVSQLLALSIGKPTFFLLMISWFLFIHREKPASFFSVQSKILFLLVFESIFVSGAFMGKGLFISLFNPTDLLKFILDSAKLWANVFLFFIIITVVRTKESLRRFIFFILFLGLSLSIVGIIQLFFQIPIFPTFRVDPNAPMVLAAGSYGDPVAYGTQIAFLLMVSFAVFLGETSKKNRTYLLVLIILLSFVLLASLNRSAILGIVVFIMVMMVLNKKAGFKLFFFLIIALILISQSAVVDLFLNQMTSIWTTISSKSGHFADRIESATAAIEVVRERPGILLFGGGLNQYEVLVRPFLTSPTAISAPSNTTALSVFTIELGLPAVLLVLLVLWATFRDLSGIYSEFKHTQDPQMHYLSQGLFASLIGLLVISLANAIWFTEFFWINLALPVVLKNISK